VNVNSSFAWISGIQPGKRLSRSIFGFSMVGRIFLTFRFYANKQLRGGESVLHFLQNHYR